MLRQLAILLLSSAIVLPASAMAQAETLIVRVVLSDDSPPYRQFSAALNKTLAASKADVNVIESQSGSNADTGLVIAVGMKATESTIVSSAAPVLGVMIPRMGYEVLLESHSIHHQTKATSAIYLDQPWNRQLDFIRTALPGHRKIGLLHSPDAHIDFASLRKSAAARGLSLTAQPVQSAETLAAVLEGILNENDLLLAIPDSAIYNSNNVRNILLTSYRYKVPLIGISQAYVNAGALGAIFSTPEQLAEQTAGVIVSFIRNKQLPEPQYPVSFSIALNQQVARSLGIVLSSPEDIRRHMDKMGEGRR